MWKELRAYVIIATSALFCVVLFIAVKLASSTRMYNQRRPGNRKRRSSKEPWPLFASAPKGEPMKTATCFWAAMLLVVFAVPLLAGPSCESLASLVSPGMKITLAQSVPAGSFAQSASLPAYPPGGAIALVNYKDLPAFCRVAATLMPPNDSGIKIEVWLPSLSAWNGKFMYR
jgi:hypothetical protein